MQTRTVIFQGPDVRDINTTFIAANTVVKINLTCLDDVKNEFKKDKNVKRGLVIFNTHGSTKDVHSMQKNAVQKPFVETRKLFEKLGASQSKVGLSVQLFACYASAACTDKIASQLPLGSLVGFYAPPTQESRMEVSEVLILKSLELLERSVLINEILWFTAPISSTCIGYRYSRDSFQFKNLGCDYTEIKNEGDLLRLKSESLTEYNDFLIRNGLNPITVNINDHRNWFRDLWFMQLVIELCASDVRRDAAIAHLKDNVVDDLKKHKISMLAGQKNLNLFEYFKAWNNPNDQPIIQGLSSIYSTASSSAAASSSSSSSHPAIPVSFGSSSSPSSSAFFGLSQAASAMRVVTPAPTAAAASGQSSASSSFATRNP